MAYRKGLQIVLLFSILLFVQTAFIPIVMAEGGGGENGGDEYGVFICPKSIMLGANVVVSGYVIPANSNETVELTYISPNDDVIVRNVSTVFEGEFCDEFPPTVTGCWQVQATWRVNATHTATSIVQYFKVYEGESEITCSHNTISLTKGSPINITGQLDPPLSDLPINIKGKIDCEWHHLATVETTVNGSFSYSWMPLEEGEYLLKAYWSGNNTICGSYSKLLPVIVTSVAANTTEKDPIPEEENPVLSVQSNSTISDLVFDSENQLLSITVSGENGTMGHVKVVLAKALVPDPSKLHVYLDEESVSYTIESTDDSWILFVHYHHSTHTIEVSLSAPSLWNVNQLLVIFSGLVMAALFLFRYVKENSVALIR